MAEHEQAQQPAPLMVSAVEREAVAGGVAALAVLASHVGKPGSDEMRADLNALVALLARMRVAS